MRAVVFAAMLMAAGPAVAQMLSDPTIPLTQLPLSGTEQIYILQNGKSTKGLLNTIPSCSTRETVYAPINATWGLSGCLISTVNNNSVVGAAVQNAPPSTLSFPVGTIGFGTLLPGSTGNAIFGLFGDVELADHGTASNEIDCFNYKGAPDTTLPPSRATGTAANNCNGIYVGAGGQYNGSVGIQISGAGGGLFVPAGTGNPVAGPQKWTTGLYIGGVASGTSGATQYGIFVDADSTGPSTSMVLRNYGTGIPLQINIQGPAVNGNAMIATFDQNAVSHFSVVQDGSIHNTGNNNIFSGVVTGTPAASACFDVSGTLIKKTTTGSCI